MDDRGADTAKIVCTQIVARALELQIATCAESPVPQSRGRFSIKIKSIGARFRLRSEVVSVRAVLTAQISQLLGAKSAMLA